MPAINRQPYVNRWLEKAQEDELTCRSLITHRDAAPGPACFHAQQIAEKYLKALLIRHGQGIPKVHDLKRIATLLERFEPKIFQLEDEFSILNKYYPATRYPGDFPEGFSWEDAQAALAAAIRIKAFVSEKMKR